MESRRLVKKLQTIELFNLNLINMKILIIVDNSQETAVKMYDPNKGNVSVFIASIFLRRRSLYYTFNLIVPSFLITVLSLMGFCLPPQR